MAAWSNLQGLPAHSYVCGYCNHKVGAHQGYHHSNYGTNVAVYICPHCDKPSYFDKNKNERMPGTTFGQDVENVPLDVSALYNEARRCYSINAFTAAVLLCRKLLMNIAVSMEAPVDQSFIHSIRRVPCGERLCSAPWKGLGRSYPQERQRGNARYPCHDGERC